MAKAEVTEPWERQKGESDQAWEAFKTYRDMDPPRSLARVAGVVGKSVPLMERWSRRWSWVERVRLHTNQLEEIARNETIREIRAFRKRAARQLAAKAQTLMLVDVAIANLLARGKTVEELIGSISPTKLMELAAKTGQALPQVVKAEALALGDVTERQEEPAPPLEENDPLTEAIGSDQEALAMAAQIVERAGESR